LPDLVPGLYEFHFVPGAIERAEYAIDAIAYCTLPTIYARMARLLVRIPIKYQSPYIATQRCDCIDFIG